MNRTRTVIAGLAVAIGIAAAQEPMSCIEELFLPKYPTVSLNGGSEAIVTANFRVSARKATDIATGGGNAPFEAEIRRALQASSFHDKCSGSALTLRFQFLLTEDAGTPAYPAVSFAPPNLFRIRVRRRPLSHGPAE
jgi:hypothetical protein